VVLLFPRKTHAVLGVDISAAAVKMVELRVANKRLWIQGFALVPLMPNTIVDNTIKDAAAVTAAIQEACMQMRITTRHVAIALPASTVISQTLLVDASLSDEELEAYIQLEAASILSFPLTEVCMDFSVLGTNKTDPTKVDVLLVAARMAQVVARRDMVTAAGLIVDFIDVETFAIERVVNYLTYKHARQTIALIHFDVTAMTLIILHQRNIIYTHEELFSTQPLTETVEFLTPLLRRAMQFFISAIPGCSVDQVLLSGVGVSALSDMVSECLSLPVTIINPFHTLSLATGVNEARLWQEASTLTIACGLALRGIAYYGGN
jgi:type IV pilus assembly protein PilM